MKRLNEIVQIKTTEINCPDGPTSVLMIAVNINDNATAEAFVSKVAEKFKIHRTLAPPNTTILLVTIIGDLTAQVFARRWREIARRDDIIRAYLSLMRSAEVVQGTKSGEELSRDTLLLDGCSPHG